MQVASLLGALSETLTRLLLDTQLLLPDVIELREPTADVSHNVLPPLHMEHGVALRNFSNDNPVVKFCDIIDLRVGIIRLGGSLFEANRAKVVIVAMVDVPLPFIFEAISQVDQGLVLVNGGSLALPIHLPLNSSTALLLEVQVQHSKPLNQRFVPSERSKVYIGVGRLEA